MAKLLKIETMIGCNARCIFCPLGARTLKRRRGQMDSELFFKIIDQAIELGFAISLYGMAEPLMEPRLFEFLDYIKSKGGKLNIFTNASLMTKTVAEKLCQYQYLPNKFAISFHGGNKEDYEKVMGVNFEKAVSNIKYLLSLKPRPDILISMKTVEENKDSIDDFRRLWGEYKVRLKISPAINLGGLLYKGSGISKCVPLPLIISVYWDGRMPLCCVDSEGMVIIGDLKKQSLKEVLEGEILKKYLDFNEKSKLNQLYPCNICDVQ